LYASPVARGPNALGRAVDTSGAEAHAPQNMMENVDVSTAILPCLRLSVAPSVVRHADAHSGLLLALWWTDQLPPGNYRLCATGDYSGTSCKPATTWFHCPLP
jgi:hypothetical protein